MNQKQNLSRKKINGNTKRMILLFTFFSFFFILAFTQPIEACGCSHDPEFTSIDSVGGIGPQKLLQITLGVYGNSKDGDVTIYSYSALADVEPGNITRFVAAYSIEFFVFDIFFNYSEEVTYFSNNIEFFIYSHSCNKIVDDTSYLAVYDVRPPEGGGDGDLYIYNNLNNTITFGLEEAKVLKLIAFGILGVVGAACIVLYVRNNDLINRLRESEGEKEERELTAAIKNRRMYLFSGVGLLLTLFTQYVAANIFFPFAQGFDFLWGNEVYGLILAGMVLFFMLAFYKKYYVLISILLGGMLFTILGLWNLYILLFSGVIAGIIALFLRFGNSLYEILKLQFKKGPDSLGARKGEGFVKFRDQKRGGGIIVKRK